MVRRFSRRGGYDFIFEGPLPESFIDICGAIRIETYSMEKDEGNSSPR